MKTHDVSPLTNKPFDHKYLTTNMTVRNLIAEWCEQNGVPVPTPPKREAESAAGGGGAALAPLLTKPHDHVLPPTRRSSCGRSARTAAALCVCCAPST
jgi:hypothetical protein